jgi:hypothetical protein
MTWLRLDAGLRLRLLKLEGAHVLRSLDVVVLERVTILERVAAEVGATAERVL